jgi:para-nitrobenzyl esterase
MASPFANSLLAKAIGESGSGFYSFSMPFPAREQIEQTDTAWAERVFGTGKLFYLRSLKAGELVEKATAKTTPPPPRFTAITDGLFLPDTIPHIFADGRQAHIPLLDGWNANDGHPANTPTADSFTVQAHTEFGPAALKFLELYPATTDAEALSSANDYASDRFMGFSNWAWLEAQVKTGHAPVYRYFFALGSPGDRNHTVAQGAFHTDDIEYVFGTLDTRPGMAIRPEDRALSDLMQQYWTNFAKTGDPNGTGLPHWPTYDPAGGWQVMHLDAAPTAQPDSLRPRYLFLDTQWGATATK